MITLIETESGYKIKIELNTRSVILSQEFGTEWEARLYGKQALKEYN